MPATALVPKNTSSGPSSIASFAQTERSASGVDLATFTGISVSGCGFILASGPGDGAGEVLRIERLEVVEALADAHRVDGELKALRDGDQDAAPCRAVELGHDEAGHARDLLEDLHLIDRVLPGGGVEHEHDAMRSALIELFQHAHNLGELGHEVRLVLQAAGGVDEEHVFAFGARPLERLIGDAGRI